MSLFQRCQKGLNCLRRIRGNVCLPEVDVGGVFPLVAQPCVNDGLCLNKRPLLSPCKLALVHVAALLLVVALGAIMPRYALADVTDVSGQDGVLDAAAIVYPYEYDAGSTDQRYRVLCEYLGFDWDSMSSTTKGHLLGEGNGDNVFVMAANNQVFNFVYDTHSYLPILNIGQTPTQTINYGWLGSLYGHSSLWLVDMDTHNKVVVKDFVAYWALPREDEGGEVTQDYSVLLDNVFGNVYTSSQFNGSTSPIVGTPVFGGSVMTSYQTSYNTIQRTVDNLKARGCNYYYFVAGNGRYQSGTSGGSRGHGRVFGSASKIAAEFILQENKSDTRYYPDYVNIKLTSESDIYASGYGNPGSSFSATGEANDTTYNGNDSFSNVGTSVTYEGKFSSGGHTYYVTAVATNFGAESYVPTPDPSPTPIPDVPDPTEPSEPSEPSGGIDIDLPDIVFPSIDITFPDSDADYRPYLRKILQTLRDTEDDLRSGINQLTAGINDLLEALDQIDRDLTTHCMHLQDAIHDVPYSINRYMKQVGNTLYLKLDRSLNNLGTSINKWLRLIYSRLKGSPSSQPSIDDDEPGFWDWLGDIFNGLINELIDKLPDELVGLLEDLEELTSYFPFSVPWDIAAVLALFAHDPVTPVIAIDWVGSQRYGIEVHWVIDLSPWDVYAESLRQLMLIAFIIGMMFFTLDQVPFDSLIKRGEK